MTPNAVSNTITELRQDITKIADGIQGIQGLVNRLPVAIKSLSAGDEGFVLQALRGHEGITVDQIVEGSSALADLVKSLPPEIIEKILNLAL